MIKETSIKSVRPKEFFGESEVKIPEEKTTFIFSILKEELKVKLTVQNRTKKEEILLSQEQVFNLVCALIDKLAELDLLSSAFGKRLFGQRTK